MIREATPWDIDQVVALAIEALKIDAYDEMRINKERVRDQCRVCISSPSDKALVAESGEVITGVVAGVVTPLAVYDRSMMNIVMWYCKSFGDGVKMMDKLMEWADGRPMIKEIEYTGERGPSGKKTTRFMCRRYGFRNDVPFIYKM